MTTSPFVLNLSENAIDDENYTFVEMMGLKGTVVPTKHFIKSLKNDIAPTIGLLPSGVKYASLSKRTWIFERAPETVTIEYSRALLDNVNDETETANYEIRLPWLAYLVDLDQTYYPESIFVYALEHSITTLHDVIGILPLSNFSAAGKLCQPHRGNVAEQPENIGDGLSLAYRMCWSSGFNMDLDENFYWCRGLRRPAPMMFASVRRGLFDSPEQVTTKWENLSDEIVEKTTDWAYPRNFDRHSLPEAIDTIEREGRQSRLDFNECKRSIGDAIFASENIDTQRRGDWGASSLQMVFQSAISQAGLYD